MRIRIGVDTGGTFTDVVAYDEETGTVVATKTPSTPADPAEGFMAAVRKALSTMDAEPGDVTMVGHGTTVATNQLLEGRIERLGFVTTEGFEFLLEIARQSVPDGYGNSYFWVKPPRIVPADLVRTVPGRLDHTGAELRPFDEDAAREVARFFRDAGIEAIGVCFLHAYANPAHEERMRDIIAAEHPTAAVSLSSHLLREYREYERAMTTLVDAAVKPRVARYVTAIRRHLDSYAGPAAQPAGAATSRRSSVPFLIMKSNGGVISAEEVVHQPIATVLSGPAAGALGAATLARIAGFGKVLTLDGGGTSTDVSVVLDGQPTLTTEGSVGGYPSKIQMIDIVTIGAGGGSIASLSPDGTLRVGPQSAGADPGPLCYRRGGTEPTVTDAHLVLGRIPPSLLGGEVPLDVDAARDGLAALGDKLGLSTEKLAAGILEISAWNQANALRQVTVKRGLDVRDFVLTAFGGSGPLLVCRLADILELRAVVVPRDPGNLSAFGLLTVDVMNDYVQTYVTRHAALDRAMFDRIYAELTEQAAAGLDAEGFEPERQIFGRIADMRYRGQAFEVPVPVNAGPDEAVAVFHETHEQLYGYSFWDRPEQEVEWVNLRVTGIGRIAPLVPSVDPRAGSDGPPTPVGRRPVLFDESFVDTPVYQRSALGVDAVVAGPAVIEEYGSTVPLHPGFTARVDPLGNLVVTRVAGRGVVWTEERSDEGRRRTTGAPPGEPEASP
jgi:N-methylhydantoinase A